MYASLFTFSGQGFSPRKPDISLYSLHIHTITTLSALFLRQPIQKWGIGPHQSQLLRNCKNKKDLLIKKVFAIYVWSRFTDSNRRPTVYKTVALTS